jgi:excisionase family DNA binding protein
MKLLTVRESAGRLGCSEALVYLLCSERRVARVRLGTGRGTFRIAEEELDEFLKNSRIDAHSLGKGLKHIRAK